MTLSEGKKGANKAKKKKNLAGKKPE